MSGDRRRRRSPIRNGHRASRGRPPTLPPSGGRPQRHRSTPLDHSSWRYVPARPSDFPPRGDSLPRSGRMGVTTSRPRGERPDRASRPAGAPRGRPRHPARRRRRGAVPAGSSRRSPAARSTAASRRARAGQAETDRAALDDDDLVVAVVVRGVPVARAVRPAGRGRGPRREAVRVRSGHRVRAAQTAPTPMIEPIR